MIYYFVFNLGRKKSVKKYDSLSHLYEEQRQYILNNNDWYIERVVNK